MSTTISYWDNNSALTSINSNLYDELVPHMGKAETVEGELLRVSNRLFHDYCNNGNGNAVETEWENEEYECSDCNGEGETSYFDNEEDEEICEVCDNCGGGGTIYEEEEGERKLADGWSEHIEFIRDNLGDDEIDRVLNIMLNKYSLDFDQKEVEPYNQLMDRVIIHILIKRDRDGLTPLKNDAA